MDIKGLLINVINTRLDANFEARRPAVQAAKDRKAIVKQEMAQLKKDQAALDKKLKKQRRKATMKVPSPPSTRPRSPITKRSLPTT